MQFSQILAIAAFAAMASAAAIPAPEAAPVAAADAAPKADPWLRGSTQHVKQADSEC